MVKVDSIILIILSEVFASNIVNYKFGSNFGQIFYDYSGSGNHGMNGNSTISDPYDTISIDRGAYFPTQNLYIRLPPNEYVPNSFNLNGDFSILMWFSTFHLPADYYITRRYNSNMSNLLSLSRTIFQNFNTRLLQPPYDSGNVASSPSYIMVPGKA